MNPTVAFIGSEELAAGFRYAGIQCFAERGGVRNLIDDVVNTCNPIIIILEESLTADFYDDIEVYEKKYEGINFIVIPALVSDKVQRRVDLLTLINEALGVSL